MTDKSDRDLADQQTSVEGSGGPGPDSSQSETALDETLGAHSLPQVDCDPGDLELLMSLLESPLPERLEPKRRLARGGMGTIELVIDRALKRRLAKKVVTAKLRGTAEVVNAFIREAQITGQLDHPAIVPVHELGIDPKDGVYFTMKVIEGATFDQHLSNLTEARGHESLFDILEIVIKICDALAFAHNRNVVHLDIKPSNVMVGEFGQVYLMDWGLARTIDDSAPDGAANRRRTEGSGSSGIVGTPAFMAPEQARAGDLDQRTDVFGVGSLLYFALTGRAPYSSGSTQRTLELARHHQTAPLSEVATITVPPSLHDIVTKAMSADPADRHQTVRELREELTRFLRGGAAFPRRQVAAGEHIMHDGEAGEEVYVLMNGRAQAYRVVDGERTNLGVIESGDVVGELAFLTQSRRTASVVAVVDCTLLVITPETLERELSGMQPWMAALTRSLAKRFREREQKSP